MQSIRKKNAVSTSATARLAKLEVLFNLKIVAINKHNFKKVVFRTMAATTKELECEPIALLIETGGRNQKVFFKLLVFLYTSMQYRYLKFKFSRIPGAGVKSYGIYPSIDKPFAVYQLNAAAETYANSSILPTVRNGLKGVISRVLALFTRYHVSTAGIVILVHKHHDTY